MTIGNAVATYGMILDILGAVVLARSFVVKRPTEVFREVRSFGTWDFPITVGARDLLVSWLVQALEAKTGAAILTLGFALQAVSQVLSKKETEWALLFLLVSAAASLWLFFWFKRIFVRRAVRQAQGFYVELAQATISEDWKREIPLRCKELNEIEAQPNKWLKQK